MTIRPVFVYAAVLAIIVYAATKTGRGQSVVAGAADSIGATARGVRNNNPGNIRHGASKWVGMAPTQTDSAFVQFVSMEYGIRALVVLLATYRNTHGLVTIRGIISRWAPSSENATDAYIQFVADYVGVDANESLDFSDYNTNFRLVRAIIAQEIGRVPAAFISDSTVNAGFRLAG